MGERPSAQQVIALLGLEPPGGPFGYALLGTSVWGRVDPERVERLEFEDLGEMFPLALPLIREFASL